MKHDFNKALVQLSGLDGLTFSRHSDAANQYSQWVIRNKETVRQALRLADKLMQEPSIEMLKAAWKSQYIFFGGSEVEAEQLAERRISDVKQLQQDNAAYKAMIVKAIEELKK